MLQSLQKEKNLVLGQKFFFLKLICKVSHLYSKITMVGIICHTICLLYAFMQAQKI